MISEGSCDTEAWSNDDKNYIHKNKLQLFKIVIIFHNITVFTVCMIK